jgi:tetratricopeptide (TPR) repeat protein
MRRSICAVLILAVCLAAPVYAHHLKQSAARSLPVTTTSVQAHALYEKGMEDYENLYLERCNDDWRAAVKEDPNLAVAWAWIAFNSTDPKEVSTAREKAKVLAPKLTPGEQLMIAWIVNFPAALNDLAYVDARNREFAKAFAAMDRYVALLPKEPNPQDSYGELLRMAGNFEGSLQHYRAALKIDPDFVTSQVGLGDTYALMGNQEQARIEYDKAIRFAHNEADRLNYTMQKGMTWVRDGKFAEADKLFLEIAETAHAKEQDLQEAQAYRHLAEYQTDDNTSLKYLQSAEDSLGHRTAVSKSDKDEEMSRILRNQVVRAAHAGNSVLADKSFQQLEAMASGSRNRVIQSSLTKPSRAWRRIRTIPSPWNYWCRPTIRPINLTSWLRLKPNCEAPMFRLWSKRSWFLPRGFGGQRSRPKLIRSANLFYTDERRRRAKNSPLALSFDC